MNFNKELNDVEVVCINLKTRKDRRKRMILQMKNKNLPLHFYTVKSHQDPKKGCLLSHLAVIKNAIQKNQHKYLMILEDDAKIIRDLLPFPAPPEDWDMLYLGGTIHNNLGEYNKDWVRIATWTCHAYIINLSNKKLVEDILKAGEQEALKEDERAQKQELDLSRLNEIISKIEKNQRIDDSSSKIGEKFLEIDEYMIKNIHYKYKCYMIKPMRIIQRDGYSDIERGEVKYDFMEGTLEGFMQPEFEKVGALGNEMALKLDFVPPELLPGVSIITPTYNRRKLFPMAIRNFQLFQYPADKMEWIIVDDSGDPDESVEDIVPKDKRIKYIPIQSKERLSVAHKRNIGNREAKYDYIVHMDDDDYYPPGSLMIRVKLLMQYKERGIECVGCSKVGIYDLINNRSSIATDGIISLSEASMAYAKKFWEVQNFNELEKEGEYKSFIHGRFNKILDVPYSYVMIAFFHKTNFTGMNKRIDKNVLIDRNTNEEMNFYDKWDEETQEYVDYLRKIVGKK